MERDSGGAVFCDLRRVEATALDPVLEEEIRCWGQLRWDFNASANLVRRFLRMHALSGVALLQGAAPVGYAYYVVEDHKGLIGDLFLSESHRTLANQDRLLSEVASALLREHHVERIESQLIMLLEGSGGRLSPEPRPATFEREFMMLELAGLPSIPAPPRIRNFRIEPWSMRRLAESAQLIQEAYRGHVDSRINDQYRSVEGASRFLQNIVHYPGCGSFFQAGSLVAVDRSSDRLCGLCLTSMVGPQAGHVTQICVHSGYRGHGLGSGLLLRSFGALAGQGADTVSLTVTSANETACRLYRRLGFRTLRRFPALVWEDCNSRPAAAD